MPKSSHPNAHRRGMVVIENADRYMLCRVDKTPDSCAGCTGCGSIAKNTGDAQLVRLPSELLPFIHPPVGQRVQIEASGEMLLALSLVVYVSPVILMLLFSVGCSFLFQASEGVVALSAACGLAVGLVAVTGLGGKLLQKQVACHVAVSSKE